MDPCGTPDVTGTESDDNPSQYHSLRAVFQIFYNPNK